MPTTMTAALVQTRNTRTHRRPALDERQLVRPDDVDDERLREQALHDSAGLEEPQAVRSDLGLDTSARPKT
jgi:hypothetical protein